ncbi:CASP-like protein [Acorus gramineus]|uniref:CASP-like protein n=1 Tax=Acorus gramineus TaxID=55184 RepID=A0AAV9BV68_ACOGR|nr:CASP-like protein [Acorus gramineus]
MDCPASPLRSNAHLALPPPENHPVKLPSPPPSAPTVHTTIRDELAVAATEATTKKEAPAPNDGSGGKGKRSRVVEGIVRRWHVGEVLRRASIGVRVCAAAFCLVSFSVMAADKTVGWAGDSFYRYKQYKYCLSVAVMGFVYSGFQAFAQVHHLISGKHILRRPIRYYFDFAMDQIFAYLLMSASSSAATRTDDWVTNWGEDPFTRMANASTAMSFLAFVAFAINSIISGYTLCIQHV